MREAFANGSFCDGKEAAELLSAFFATLKYLFQAIKREISRIKARLRYQGPLDLGQHTGGVYRYRMKRLGQSIVTTQPGSALRDAAKLVSQVFLNVMRKGRDLNGIYNHTTLAPPVWHLAGRS